MITSEDRYQIEQAAQAAALEAAAKEVCSGCAQGLELNGSDQHNFHAFGWQNCEARSIRALIKPTAIMAGKNCTERQAERILYDKENCEHILRAGETKEQHDPDR